MSDALFSDFSKTTDQVWLDKILTDLKGKKIQDIAAKDPIEEIDYEVFYTASKRPHSLELNLQNDWFAIPEAEYLEMSMADPIHHFIETGHWLTGENNDLDSFIEIFKYEKEKKLGINGKTYKESGANCTYELACILSHTNEYLHLLKKDDLLSENLLNRLLINVSIGNDFFLEIAKLRALRVLIANLSKPYEIDAKQHFKIHAVNSQMNFSSADVDTNILRSTSAAMSAIIGGVDYLALIPHNALLDKGHNDFENRIAQNIQLMMKHEAHLDKVLDPGSGSYFIEWLTQELCERAWNSFKDIESKGGLIEAFADGHVQSIIEKTADLRKKRFQAGTDVRIGINKYQVEGSSIANKTPKKGNEEFKGLRPLILEENQQ